MLTNQRTKFNRGSTEANIRGLESEDLKLVSEAPKFYSSNSNRVAEVLKFLNNFVSLSICSPIIHPVHACVTPPGSSVYGLNYKKQEVVQLGESSYFC